MSSGVRPAGATSPGGAARPVRPSSSAPVPWTASWRPRVSARLGAVLAIALLPLVLFGGYAAMKADQGRRAEVEWRLLEVARTIASALDAEIRVRIRGAELLAMTPAFDRFPDVPAEDMQVLLQRLRDFAPGMGEFASVWRLDGPVPIRIASARAPLQRLAEPVVTPEVALAIRGAAEERRPVASDMFCFGGDCGFIVAVPVLRGDRAVAAVTVALLTRHVQALLAAQALPRDAVASVVDGRFRVVARIPERHIGSEAGPDFQLAASGEASGLVRLTSLDSTPVIAAFTTPLSVPAFRASVGAPAAAIEAEWRHTRALLVAGGAIALGVAVTAILLWDLQWSRTRQRMQDQEAHLGIALAQSGLATWEADLRTGIATWSPQHFDMLGYPRDPDGRATPRMWWDAVHPEDIEAVREQWRLAEAHPDGVLRLNYRLVRQDDGEVRWFESIGRILEDGRTIGVLVDETEARRDEQERLLLAREVDHRAKNLLAVVQAMVTMTRAGDAETLRAALLGRVLSLAKAHDLLARNRWTGSTLRELAEAELSSFGAAVELDGEEVALRAHAVQSLAMVLHELATNSVKYGALSSADGRVVLSWDASPTGLEIRWTERHGPPVQPPLAPGFGTRMMSRVLAQVGGSVEFAWDMEGLSVRLGVPASCLGRP
ncbi:sensor histidine kinase [Falsiroseomonas sp. HW251]|uniref:sensor histidine kinase n=1 Tax=Falsiroseomonas sp. HW251 TaxID=3390998 RepID=UPI003D32328D